MLKLKLPFAVQSIYYNIYFPYHYKIYFISNLDFSLLIRAVKRLIAINRIQNKSLCLHNIYV